MNLELAILLIRKTTSLVKVAVVFLIVITPISAVLPEALSQKIGEHAIIPKDYSKDIITGVFINFEVVFESISVDLIPFV